MGIVANQGDLDEQSSLKGAHFVRLCSLRDIPLVFLVNTPSDQDFLSSHGSPGNIAKARAQMMATLATSHVPKITVVCGGSYGPSAYAMVRELMHTLLMQLCMQTCAVYSVAGQCSLTSCSLGHMEEWAWLHLHTWRLRDLAVVKTSRPSMPLPT